jgi:hypothetical protein
MCKLQLTNVSNNISRAESIKIEILKFCRGYTYNTEGGGVAHAPLPSKLASARLGPQHVVVGPSQVASGRPNALILLAIVYIQIV